MPAPKLFVLQDLGMQLERPWIALSLPQHGEFFQPCYSSLAGCWVPSVMEAPHQASIQLPQLGEFQIPVSFVVG